MPSSNVACFASSCAERLFPVIQSWRPETMNLCALGISTGWDHLRHGHMPQSLHHVLTSLHTIYEDVVKTVPDIYTVTFPLTEYAIHSVVCVLQYVRSGDNKYAVSAGRCVINAVDLVVAQFAGIGEDGLYDQKHVAVSPLMQKELEKQRADLDKLLSSSIYANLREPIRLESQEIGRQFVQHIQQRFDQQAASWMTVRANYTVHSKVVGDTQYFDPSGIVVKLDRDIQGILKFDSPNVASQKHLFRAWTKITALVIGYDDDNHYVILKLLQVHTE